MRRVGRRGGAWVVVGGMVAACSGGAVDRTVAGASPSSVVVAQGPQCTVDWVKMDYREPGGDSSQYLELHVTKGSALIQTLGDCGLGSLVLLRPPCTA